jgi:sialate O-acetylesterase
MSTTMRLSVAGGDAVPEARRSQDWRQVAWRACMLRAAVMTAGVLAGLGQLSAETTVPSIFGDHMVLQRDHANPVWGWSTPGAQIRVGIADQQVATTADATGAWRVVLAAMTGSEPLEMTIASDRDETRTFRDILLGEVWVCSGQSNMELPVGRVFGSEVEILSANYPAIRLMTLKKVLAVAPRAQCEGDWAPCTPESVANFSAIGYFFGRRLHQALQVPIGLIDNSWGGSTAEAWISRATFAQSPSVMGRVVDWERSVEGYTDETHAHAITRWKEAVQDWKSKGGSGRGPREPKDLRTSFGYGNIYNGMVNPVAGYGIRGMIWYQGESNASSPGSYRTLFPMVIDTMRAAWGQGDFPFYWLQLADNYPEKSEPGPSRWAELREVQTLTVDERVHTGQAVIIDVGRGMDGHPLNKQVPAERLVRWALANDYGFPIACSSPRYRSHTITGNKMLISFDHVSDHGLISYDLGDPVGFAIAGEDHHFAWASATIVGKDQVEVWSDAVANPVAVRYGWADNPRVSLFDGNGLPATPFRTDSWRDPRE